VVKLKPPTIQVYPIPGEVEDCPSAAGGVKGKDHKQLDMGGMAAVDEFGCLLTAQDSIAGLWRLGIETLAGAVFNSRSAHR
jgi:hypothetical protein